MGIDALELAWNGIPFDSPVILPGYRQFLESLIQKKIWDPDRPLCRTASETADEIRPLQPHRTHPLVYHRTVQLKCRHCYVDAPGALYGELPLSECVRIMDQMAEANLFSVSQTGGEPLVRPDWRIFYEALKEHSLSVSAIYTNGLLVTDRWLDEFEKLEDRKVKFLLSFDGIGHHDWLRGRKGVKHPVLNAIRRLEERGLRLRLRRPFTRITLTQCRIPVNFWQNLA